MFMHIKDYYLFRFSRSSLVDRERLYFTVWWYTWALDMWIEETICEGQPD